MKKTPKKIVLVFAAIGVITCTITDLITSALQVKLSENITEYIIGPILFALLATGAEKRYIQREKKKHSKN